jgi:hypothetical protein
MRALLVHGIARTPLSLVRLGGDLRRIGCAPEYGGYFATTESFARISNRVSRRVAALAGAGDDYVLIGHSMGGLLLRIAAASLPPSLPGPRHLIMLGTPNHSPRLARRLHPSIFYKLMHGDCGRVLADPNVFANIPSPTHPSTIIAGTRSLEGPDSPFGDEPNDGIVALAEARLTVDIPVIELYVGHARMPGAKEVRDAVLGVVKGLGTGD